MVDEDSLQCRQHQTKRDRDEPEDVHVRIKRVIGNSFVWKEYRAIENQDQVDKVEAEPAHVADHHELIRDLDLPTERLVTSTKFSDASSKLTGAADGAVEVIVQCAELVVENPSDNVVH